MGSSMFGRGRTSSSTPHRRSAEVRGVPNQITRANDVIPGITVQRYDIGGGSVRKYLWPITVETVKRVRSGPSGYSYRVEGTGHTDTGDKPRTFYLADAGVLPITRKPRRWHGKYALGRVQD